MCTYRKRAQRVDIAACIRRVFHSMEMISAVCCCWSALLHIATMAAHQKIHRLKLLCYVKNCSGKTNPNATSSWFRHLCLYCPRRSDTGGDSQSWSNLNRVWLPLPLQRWKGTSILSFSIRICSRLLHCYIVTALYGSVQYFKFHTTTHNVLSVQHLCMTYETPMTY